MFFKSVMLFSLLLLYGCTNHQSSSVLLSKARKKYEAKEYKNAAQLLRELDTEYAWTDETMEALLLRAKSTLESGKRDWWTANKDLLETIQIADLLLAYDPQFALKNDVYMVKVYAYLSMLEFNTQRCDQMARKLLASIKEYEETAIQHNMRSCYERNRKELDMLAGKCRHLITARTVEQAKRAENKAASLELLDLAANDPEYGYKYPELYYRKLERMLDLNSSEQDIYNTLADLYIHTKSDVSWLKKGISMFEQRVNQDKVTAEQKENIEVFKEIASKQRKISTRS